MEVREKTAVVTGAASGIGRAIAAALAARGARVMVADISPGVHDAGAALGVAAWQGDVAAPDGIRDLLAAAEAQLGPVDLYFANAGIIGPPGLNDDEAEWDRAFDVNVRAHIRAAQQLIPGWQERGEGYFVSTASAAGLLTQIGQAAYSVTKHAAIGFAEWLSITYGDDGIRASCLAPMGVNTPLLRGGETADSDADRTANRAVTSAGRVLEPVEVAEVVMAAVESETFLILPHPEVLEMYRMKGSDYDRWLRGMRRYQRTLAESAAH
jgi:NAD(P)-dependent dehydrogenase (short-subunit alcohol dehydrogenase family)